MGEKYPLTGKQYERYHERNIRESALLESVSRKETGKWRAHFVLT